MNLKDIKELKKHLKDSMALLELADAKESDQEAILQKALNREAHLINENEELKKEHDEAVKKLSEALEVVKNENAELKAKVEELEKYIEESKKPAKKAASGFRIKGE